MVFTQFLANILAGLLLQLPKLMVEFGYIIWLILIVFILFSIYILLLERENGFENIRAHPEAVTVVIFVLTTLLFTSLAALAHTRNQEATAAENLTMEIKALREKYTKFQENIEEKIQSAMSKGTNRDSKELTVLGDQLDFMRNYTDETLAMLKRAEERYERDNKEQKKTEKTLREQIENCRDMKSKCETKRFEFELKNQICQDQLTDIQRSENRS